MTDVVILIPTLERPHHIKPLMESIKDTTDRARALFICNKQSYYTLKAIERHGGDILMIDSKPFIHGDYAKKINYGYRNSTEPLIFLGATDLKFHPNWLENAERHLSRRIHVVGTNDLGNPAVLNGEHSTHSLVTRKYVDKYGTIDKRHAILCEEYWHEWVDNEFLETAKARRAFAMAMDSHVEHVHPAFGKNKWDETYRAWKKRTIEGGKLFEQRKKMWT